MDAAFPIADVVIIFVLALSTLVGFIRGFFKEVLSLAVWVMAFWLSTQLTPVCALLLKSQVSHGHVRYIIAFFILLFLFLILGGIAKRVCLGVLERLELSGTDRLLGGGFGFLRGVLLIAVALLLLALTPIEAQPWWKASHLIPRFSKVVHVLERRVPKPWLKRLHDIQTDSDPVKPELDDVTHLDQLVKHLSETPLPASIQENHSDSIDSPNKKGA